MRARPTARSGASWVRAEVAAGRTLGEALDAGTAGALGSGTLLRLEHDLRAELLGAGTLLAPLLAAPDVTDVLVNGPTGVWADRGDGLVRVPDPRRVLGDEGAVRGLATRLAAACGRRLDDAAPVVDGTLPDGTRLHAVIPPLAADGTTISLRTFRDTTLSLADLVALRAVPAHAAPVLRALVTARANVVLSGATGTGKTTTLAALLGLADPGERIVCLEDSVELRPAHPHVVHLQVRRPNVQMAGEITLADLVRAAMRMRPDRIVLGECRGAEIRDVLGALNTGHEGGWATVHANTAQDVPSRLVALAALAGMSESTLAAQAASGIDAVVHLRRTDGRRHLAQVGVLHRIGDRLECVEALTVAADGRVSAGPGVDRLASRVGDAAVAAALGAGARVAVA
ncbi:TadA family conjugal transfer-associated ATPase [Georgenia sp. Z1344]|uniref:TadA family conjugal transfer-associated ATPase n=1 Tax=Georgenia sp. Z1344 TaxID=3416706 RepID=UPI003CEBBDE7